MSSIQTDNSAESGSTSLCDCMSQNESRVSCICSDEMKPAPPSIRLECECAAGDQGFIIHQETCIHYKHETFLYPSTKPVESETSILTESLDTKVATMELCICGLPVSACICERANYVTESEDLCLCCKYPTYRCRCDDGQKTSWRQQESAKQDPTVLEPDHPLMKKFQDTLRTFLTKENELAINEINELSEDLKNKKSTYDNSLEIVYRSDHDTNQQRAMIEEYEITLNNTVTERVEAENKNKETAIQYKQMKDHLNQTMINEREVYEEMEALSMLCQQFEQWQKETEADLSVKHRMSEKMKIEKKALNQEKRELDMIIYHLNTITWHLESEIELFRKQIKVKSLEMEEVQDKMSNFTVELEGLDQEERRLMHVWNSVLVNIQQRDKVYTTLRDEYQQMQENYRTLLANLDVVRKTTSETMRRGQDISMTKDRMLYDVANANKLYENEQNKRVNYEMKIVELAHAIELTEKDQALVANENATIKALLKTTVREYEKLSEKKIEIENQVLEQLQSRLLNDKAVEIMANNIKKMRDKTRKQEVNVMISENHHAKMMLEIEVAKQRTIEQQAMLEKELNIVQEKEMHVNMLEEQVNNQLQLIGRKQRELDAVVKKLNLMIEQYDSKSPQERKFDAIEKQIQEYKNETEKLQQDWLRLQSHVVHLSTQHHAQLADINLIRKQLQICDQKGMRLRGECEKVDTEKFTVNRTLATLRSQLEVLSRQRYENNNRNINTQYSNNGLTYEYTAQLKDAEMDILKIEEDITDLESEKEVLNEELNKIQRDALVWQKKGILAVELKRNMLAAKSQEGEIFKMKSEIHKMSVRRTQLKRIAEKLATDLAHCVTRRETVTEKTRAMLAVNKPDIIAAPMYAHKVRQVKGDIARVNKDIEICQNKIEKLLKEQTRLQMEVETLTDTNCKLENKLHQYKTEIDQAIIQKQWNLERIVRCQRLGTELMSITKKEKIKISKPDSVIITDFEQSKALNERLIIIASKLIVDFPTLANRVMNILNTLNIRSPTETPRSNAGT